jgi:hypothetical protein
MDRLLRALALSAMLLAPAGAAFAQAPAATPDEDVQGAVGVCVRWGADPTRLADVVVVKPSGDARVDAVALSALREMPLPKPPGDTGAWRPMNMGIGGAEPSDTPPDCGGLAASVSDDEPLVTRPLPKQIAA